MVGRIGWRTAEPGYALTCGALAHGLGPMASAIPPALWWDLLGHLIQTVHEASGITVSTDPLTAQLLTGELPLALSYLFPEISACRALYSSAYQTLSSGLVDLLDGEGMFDSQTLPWHGPLLACWTRSRALGKEMNEDCWSKDAELQYQWLVTQTLRLSRRDGRLMFSHGAEGAWSPDLVASALVLGGDRADRAAASIALPSHSPTAKTSKRQRVKNLPEPATNSEWASVAILRPDWSRSSDRLGVKYGGQAVEIELSCGRDIVLAGTWDASVTIDGDPLSPTSDWEELCWVSDDDVDYLELEIDLENDVRIQRQILMAREDGFLYVADLILGCGRSETIEYCGTLPFGPNVKLEPAEETTEAYLVGSKLRGLVMPLGLSEWRSDSRLGSLRAHGPALELRSTREGRNLCSPLFIDLNLRRMTKQRTWRQLTVAESLEVQPHDVAVGYRIQCGREQWLVYRSLVENANRTVLGQNISTEFVVGQFTPDGEVEELLEIE